MGTRTPRAAGALALAVVVAALLLLAATPQPGSLTPEIVVGLRRVTAVALEPGGEGVAYSLLVPRSAEEEPGRPYSEIWVAGLDGGAPRRYTTPKGSASAPAWSPDGRQISFLARREAHDPNTQIYAMPVDGGEARPLSRHPTSISAYRWSPSGDRIAFVAPDPETEEEAEAREAGRDWVVGGEGRHRRLWILEVASGEARKAYEEDLSTWAFEWAPGGEGLVLQATEEPRIDDSYMFRRVYWVAADGGGLREICCPGEGKLGPMSLSPDGDRLAYLGATSLNDPLAQSLFVLPLGGGTPRNLTEGLEGSAIGVEWIDERTLLLLAIEGTRTTLNRIDARTGSRAAVLTSGPILQSVELDPASGRLAAVAHSREHPGEVYAGSLGGGELRRVSRSNPELDGVRLARQETVEWEAPDGWRIEGLLTYPLEYEAGRRYPLILQIHGGPEGVNLDGWTTTALYPVQLLAAAGYAVLEPNYRGSGGRGVAFSKADHDDLGGREFGDILAGIDALVERGLVDPQRVGTGGWSYGGYMSAWAATRHSDRFRAAVVAAGIANWISFAGTTDIPYEMSLVHWDSWWFDEPDLHWRRSPLAHLDGAATPVLVIHGSADERVHPGQGLELYTALRIRGIPTELVVYPREPHGLLERAHQLDFIRRVLGWFDRHLGGSEPPG